MSHQKILIRPEQLYVTARLSGGFCLGGAVSSIFPWEKLRGCSIYSLRASALLALLSDAVTQGFHVLSGYGSDRRGLRGFEVGIGAWGVGGKVNVKPLDAWGLEEEVPENPGEDDGAFSASVWAMRVEGAVERAEASLRRVCLVLNGEPTPFRSSAFRWLGSLYDRMGAPLEPEGFAETLPGEVAQLCRRAHVGGPIVHVRTSLSPYVSIDRDRAYGAAMLEALPCGQAYDVPLSGLGLDRWRPRALMSALGICDATVVVEEGDLVPLLPLHRPAMRFDRAKTIYPTGTFRGAWCLAELAQLEATGRGRVVQLHRVYTFEGRPVFRPMIQYLRRVTLDVPVKMKRLEHLLYGKCARSVSLTRLSSGPAGRACLPRDVLDDRSLHRVEGRVDVRPMPTSSGGRVGHPLWQISAQLNVTAERGAIDRPDRAAWITSHNRCAMGRLIDVLDGALGSTRRGGCVGRVYVDGMDIEADTSLLPPLPGASVRRRGPLVRIYRAGATVYRDEAGVESVEATGQSESASTEADLVGILRQVADPDGGPFAEGRFWTMRGDGSDPRSFPGEHSEPLHVDRAFARELGFCDGLKDAG